MRKIIHYLPLGFFIVIAILVSIKLFNPVKIHSPLIGKKISNFSLTSNVSPDNKLRSIDLEGSLYLINFFTSWCNYCHLEHNFLVQLAEKNILPIYGIAVKDDPTSLAKFLDNHGNPYQDVGIDTSGRIAIEFGIKGFPETILVNKEGIIIYHLRGMLTDKLYNKEIAPLVIKELNKEAVN